MNQYILFYDGQLLYSGEYGGFSTGFQKENDIEAKKYANDHLLPKLRKEYKITKTTLYRFVNLD